jgi:3-oxoacid CoA-transferase
VALIKAWKGDEFGNLVFRETARNFNPVMAKAARTTLVEVEELVPTGAIDPDEIHLSGIYVDGMVLGGTYEKQIMHLTVSRDESAEKKHFTETMSPREKIAKRAAKEFRTGMYGNLHKAFFIIIVNLGIGMPEHASNFISKDTSINIDSENGVLGLVALTG